MKVFIKKKFQKIVNYFFGISNDIQIQKQLLKASAAKLQIDPRIPSTWEFSGFSQNGEDGVIDFLLKNLKNSNKYFVEIGSSTGIENNTSYLAIVRRFSGIMIDGDEKSHNQCQQIMSKNSYSVKCLNMFVDKESIHELKDKLLYNDPDVWSLDIDGNDYYLAKTILDSEIRPKIFIVEYNSAFGPHQAITIAYDKNFIMSKAHSSCLYYGVSIKCWRDLFEPLDYYFVGVESNGVNAFFIDKNQFDEKFIKELEQVDFKENFYQHSKFGKNWIEQFEIIKSLKFNIFPK